MWVVYTVQERKRGRDKKRDSVCVYIEGIIFKVNK